MMTDKNPDPFACYRLTTLLISTWGCLGLVWQMISPSVPDLKDLIGVDYEQIGRTLFAQSAGFFVGSILGGIIFEVLVLYGELIMSAGVTVGALGILMIPWARSLAFLATALFLTGLAAGVMNAGGNIMVLDLWRERASSPMHSLHFGFGVGSIMTPLLVKPYLSQKKWMNLSSDGNDTAPILSDVANSSQLIEVTVQESHLLVPFCIGGSIILLIAVLFLVSFFLGPPAGFPRHKGCSKWSELCSTQYCGYGYKNYGAFMLLVLCLYYVHAAGSEHAYGKYLFSFAVESEVHFSKDEAAMLSSTFWVMFTVGRALGTVAAHWISTTKMLVVEISLCLVSSCALALWGHNTPWILWTSIFGKSTAFPQGIISLKQHTQPGIIGIGSCVFALMNAPMFPGGLSWANLVLNMTSMAVMVCLLGASSGSMLYVYFSGYLFHHAGPASIMYLQVGIFAAMIIILGLMELLSYKFKAQKTQDKQVGSQTKL